MTSSIVTQGLTDRVKLITDTEKYPHYRETFSQLALSNKAKLFGMPLSCEHTQSLCTSHEQPLDHREPDDGAKILQNTNKNLSR